MNSESAAARRERRLFEQALDLDPGSRTAFLARACGADAGLRARIEDLFAAAAEADAFFSRPALDDSTANPDGSARDCITRIGRYRVLERVGEGGHGVVYRAEQSEPVRRQVALKIIRLGMDTEAVIERFSAERQALALMEHPYIARVLDAGATEAGRPFFVMEWVQGEPITHYCERHRLPLAERIELFIRVCQAVQHAHQKGVIHRDLKPSNLLVIELDGQPLPKVIDFGIAKAAGSGLVAPTLQPSEAGQFIGTPAYMSPEHAEAEGRGVDTRGDVFSLGVVLCELLAGRPPFAATDWSLLSADQVRHHVRERAARPPSALLAEIPPDEAARLSAQRRLGPERLATRLRGDLDCITLKALAPDRERRYDSVAAFAADLRAHLGHAVVSARPPSRCYQATRFVRRHRGPVLAVSLVLASVVAGLVTATRLYWREQDALAAQVALAAQAEEARANEARLRRQAEAGERIARAAVQLSYNRPDLADALVTALDLTYVQPSLESALVFRTLALRHAQADRWPQAARLYGALAESITTIDPTDTDGVSWQLMPAATAILRAGDLPAYHRYRGVLLRRFGTTQHPIVAEQVLKSTLLAPADAETLARLAPLADIVRASIVAPGAERDAYMYAWRAFCIALFDYRCGRPAEAARWNRLCLDSTDTNAARSASAHLLQALAYQALRQDYAFQLARADALFKLHAETPRDGRAKLGGYWFDWVNAELLRGEISHPGEIL